MASLDPVLALEPKGAQFSCMPASVRQTVEGLSLMEFINKAEAELMSLQLPAMPLQHVCEQQLVPNTDGGLWLEFGVGTGTTLRLLGDARAPLPVYGFDWFQGLPEDWLPDYGMLKGSFAMPQPKGLPENAQLVFGLFEDTVEGFLAEHSGTVELAHVDCDIYSSTVTVLTALTDRLAPGSILVFDELLYYPQRENHEVKAFYEWLQRTGWAFEWIGIQGQQTGADLVNAAKDDPAIQARLLGPDNSIVPWDIPLCERVALRLVE